MEYEVIFSEISKHDLFEIYYYIAINDSFEKADKLRENLECKCMTLSKFPKRGSRIREISAERPDILQIIYIPYIIIYKIENKKITILSIIDERRSLLTILEDRFLNN